MDTKIKNFSILIWIVFIDSLGWGIAFSVFASLFFSINSTILSPSTSHTARYMLYEFFLAIYSFFMFFCAPILGSIADYYGRKPSLKISMFGLSVGFILCALGCYFSSLWFLLLGRIISGMTAGSVSVAQAATVDISTQENKSYYLSILMLANTLGFSLGPLLGGLFTLSKILPNGVLTFSVAALLSIVGFLGVSLFFKETYNPQHLSNKLNFLKDFLNIKIAFSKPILKNYLFSLLFSMIAFGLFYSNIPVFLNRVFIPSPSTTGFILSAGAILFSLALVFSGKYVFNYFEQKRTVFITQLIQLIVYLILALCIMSFYLNVALFAVISLFAGVMYIGLLTLISNSVESDWQGRVMGVVASLSSVSWGVGPLLTGFLNHYNPSIAFICCSLFVLFGLLSLYFLYIRDKNKAVNLHKPIINVK